MYKVTVNFKDYPYKDEDPEDYAVYNNVKYWGLTSKETMLRIQLEDKTLLFNMNNIFSVFGEKYDC